MSVWLSDAQVDEAGHRQTHIEPVTEAEVVDELEHVLHTQEDQPHQPLQNNNTHTLLCMHFRNVMSVLVKDKFPYIEEQCRYGGIAFPVDQTQTVGEVALSGPDEKQPA